MTTRVGEVPDGIGPFLRGLTPSHPEPAVARTGVSLNAIAGRLLRELAAAMAPAIPPGLSAKVTFILDNGTVNLHNSGMELRFTHSSRPAATADGRQEQRTV